MGIMISFYESSGFIYIFYFLYETSNFYTETSSITDDSSSESTRQSEESIECMYIMIFIEIGNEISQIFSCRYLEKAISKGQNSSLGISHEQKIVILRLSKKNIRSSAKYAKILARRECIQKNRNIIF